MPKEEFKAICDLARAYAQTGEKGAYAAVWRFALEGQGHVGTAALRLAESTR